MQLGAISEVTRLDASFLAANFDDEDLIQALSLMAQAILENRRENAEKPPGR